MARIGAAGMDRGLLSVGCRVRLTMEEGEYTGTVHALSERDRLVTLLGVTLDCGGGRQEKLRGVQKFQLDVVREVKLLEAPPDAPVPVQPATQTVPPRRDKPLMDQQSHSDRPAFSQRLVDDTLLLAHIAIDDSDDETSPAEGSGGESPAAPRAATPPPLLPRPEGYVVIDQVDDELTDAVQYLEQQTMVGLSAEGVLMGRGGELSLITIACADFSFVFDLLSCGRPGVEALKSLLESKAVQKVIHDCRGLSDLLAHQYSVRLANVFDTQAAEVYLYHKKHGVLPAYVAAVSNTLVTRLRLLPRQVFFPRYALERLKEEQRQVWMRRPLTERLLEGAVQNAVYLRELRHVQVEEMFSTYVRCVDVYLDATRQADNEDAANAPFECERLPVRVEDILMAPKRPDPRGQLDHENPRVVNNVVAGVDPQLRFSRNVWRMEP